MEIHINATPEELGKNAAKKAADLICLAIEENGHATIILATGTSQLHTLKHLIDDPRIAWQKVSMFHLDEYIGLDEAHPASFRRYLRERFLSEVAVLEYQLINGQNDIEKECERLNGEIMKRPVDVALVGIGENGHLAFNDPPADFETEAPYIVVNLDEACRKQQLGEGWFRSVEEVPKQAISMSIRQIMKSKHIVCSVPDERKALAVQNTLQREVHNMFPASILQLHSDCYLYLDNASASRLSGNYSARTHE